MPTATKLLCLQVLSRFPKIPVHFGKERSRQGLKPSRAPHPQPIHSRRKSVSPTPQHPVCAALENTAPCPHPEVPDLSTTPAPAPLQQPLGAVLAVPVARCPHPTPGELPKSSFHPRSLSGGLPQWVISLFLPPADVSRQNGVGTAHSQLSHAHPTALPRLPHATQWFQGAETRHPHGNKQLEIGCMEFQWQVKPPLVIQCHCFPKQGPWHCRAHSPGHAERPQVLILLLSNRPRRCTIDPFAPTRSQGGNTALHSACLRAL